jgi:hypothetical protein
MRGKREGRGETAKGDIARGDMVRGELGKRGKAKIFDYFILIDISRKLQTPLGFDNFTPFGLHSSHHNPDN